MNNNEKRYIPGTNPKWKRELPEGYSNSLVDDGGNNWDNGYNFDERDDDEDDEKATTFDDLASQTEFDPEAAKKAREEKSPND